MKILIATTNPGKFDEIVKELSDLNIDFVNLKQVNLDREDVDEPFPTMKENAFHKAEFYAVKSGLPTIAEDTGFFVSYLNGEPGVKAKRFGATSLERNEKIIKSLIDVPVDKRGAYFQTDACYFDPKSGAVEYFMGRVDGIIANEIIGGHRDGLSYDCIFIHPKNGKAFSEITLEEKNKISHRGDVLRQIHNYLRQITN
jgi:XTP/dITP diphosphohydrolase